MNIFVLLFQLLFSIPLFFIIEFFNKKEVSLVQKVLIPVIYIILLTGIFNSLKPLVFIVVIFEVLVHDFYYNNISNNSLVNKKEFFITSLISIILSIVVYNYYINSVTVVLPSAEEFKGFIWFLVILFLYGLCKDNFKKIELDNKIKFIERKREYVIVSFAKFKNKYYRIVNSKNSDINRLIYSIMIYENYKVSKIARFINNIKYKFIDTNKKYGIMQVEIDKEISDEESIKLVLDLFSKRGIKKDIDSLLKEKYSDENVINDIKDIYNEIDEFEKR